MSRTHKPRDEIFVVVRYDAEMGEPEHQFTVTEAVWDEPTAAAEVERLNRVNASKGCRYFYRMTRLFPPRRSASGGGTRGPDADTPRPAV